MQQNKVNHLFEYANKKSCELALSAKEISKKNVLIAGSIPAQFDTYKEDSREAKVIYESFLSQIKCIIEYVDFIYLDVISSGKEIAIATEIIEKFDKLHKQALNLKAIYQKQINEFHSLKSAILAQELQSKAA